MQKIGSSTKKIKATIGENLDAGEILRRPSSLDSLPVDTEETATQEGLHSAPETSTKPKTRSRLSAAIRKLSKSRRKKKDKSLPKTTSPEPSETIVSSGAEEQPSESIAAGGQENLKQKKPSKLSKRFLLAGLKRSKISPKQDPVEKDDIPTVRTLSQTTSTDELITQSGKQSPSAIPKYTRPSLVSDLVASGGLQRVDRISKVQITLRGKKVVPAQSSDDVRRRVFSAKTTAAKAASDSIEELQKEPTEKDYLTPTEEDSSAGCHTSSAIDQVRDPSASPASSSSTHGTVTDLAKAKKKKIKSKKIYNTTTTSTASCKATQASSIPTVTPISPFTGSTSITSPPTTAPPTEEKFVITQSRRDTPPLEQAPAKPSRVAVVPVSQPTTSTGEIRKPIIRAAPSLTAKRYESRRTTIAVQQSNTLHSATETESDLMQGGFERGHRFPKPTTPIAIEPNPSTQGNKTLESTDATTPAVTNPQQRQRQIKFQLQSVASQNLSQPSPPPSPIEDFAEQPTTSSFLQKPRNSPPPPPPVTSGAATSTSETSESRSPDRSNSLLPSEQLYLATRILPKEVKSVASAHRNDPDEAISSAESAQQQDSDLYSSYNRRARYSAGYALSQDSQSTLRAEDSNDSDKSSASPVSESNRRRIRYVAQPTLYDENDRIESRREALSYLFSAAVIDSTDSDFDQYDGYQMPAFGDLTMEQMEPPIMTSTGEKREHLYKILVIGELGTGKTSFIKRYVHQFFSQNYRATIGVDFALKVLHWDANTVVRLQLWDIAGQERFGNMTRVYYKEAVGAFIVFDVTRSGTFDCVSKWKDDLDSKVQLPDGSPIPCILLANKCDQDKQGIVATPEKIDEYVRENGFAGWFETSAKENINIDEAARALVNKILLNDKLISDADLADSEKFNLNTADPTSSESKGKCSC